VTMHPRIAGCRLPTPNHLRSTSAPSTALAAHRAHCVPAGSHTSPHESPARRSPPATSRPPSEGSCPRRSARRSDAYCARRLSECARDAPVVRDTSPCEIVRAAPRGYPRGSARTLPPTARPRLPLRLCACAGTPRATTPRRWRGAATRTHVRDASSRAPLSARVSLRCSQSSVSPTSFPRSAP